MVVRTPIGLKKAVRISKKKKATKKVEKNPFKDADLDVVNSEAQDVISEALGRRWYKLKDHPERLKFWSSIVLDTHRFIVVPSGRRSGKTEYAKRGIVLKALTSLLPDGWFVCAAPTRDQAKRIYWNDLKRLVPKSCIAKISESELTIWLVHGPKIQVMGMEKPERVEGTPLDGIILDEYGNMKKSVWIDHVRPALATIGRPGWCWFIGVPEGRNHYYDLARKAQGKRNTRWAHFHWTAEDILDEEELADLRSDLDELTYRQEILGSFINFKGRAYYGFDQEEHAIESLEYNPDLDIALCFDFNVEPGVCAVLQEQVYHGDNHNVSKRFTACIGEVYIPKHSNTPRVCERILKDWKHHRGDVLLYGDATGGARGSAKIAGSDWEIIRKILKPVFGQRLKFRVNTHNPPERSRVNSMNARIKTYDGKIRFLVDPDNAPHVVKDFEGVCVIEGGSGELDKKSDLALTHISDGIGYYVAEKYPIEGGQLAISDM